MNRKLSSRTIAATYIGTVVGAAFASGQEILQFFGYFGLKGLAGIVLTTFLLIGFGYLVMESGHRLRADSYQPVLYDTAGPWLGRGLDWVITFFLFSAVIIMAAGAGAFFKQHLGLSFVVGSALMTLATWATVLAGLTGVITAISSVAPVLLVSTLSVGLFTLITNWQLLPESLLWSQPAKAPVPLWPLSALIYASYNLVLAVAVLAPMGKRSDPPELLKGSVGGSFGLGLAAASILTTILIKGRETVRYELPMLAAAESVNPAISFIYGFVLLAEIYTTAVSSLFGFGSRLASGGSMPFWLIVSLAAGGSFLLAQVGFSELVSTVFPAVGYAGLALLAGLVVKFWRDRRIVLLRALAFKPTRR